MGTNERTRRQYLAALGAAGATGLTGCVDLISSGISDETKDEYVQVATQSASAVEQWRTDRIETARLYAQHDSIRGADPSDIQAFLEDERSRLSDDLYQIHYVDTNSWDVLASTSAAKQGAPLNTREAPWQAVEITYGEDDVFVSAAQEVHRRSIVSFVSSVETGGDRDIVLVVMSNFGVIASDLPTTTDRGYTYIVDENGRVVGTTRAVGDINRNDGTLETYRGGADAPVLQRGLNGESGFVENPERADGEGDSSYVAAFAPVPDRSWVAITHVPTENIS